MSLTDTAIRTAKPKMKDGTSILNRITDSKGMYLLVTASGQKYFRYDYLIGEQKR